MAFEPAGVAVGAGQVEVVLHNDDLVLHDLRFEEHPLIVEAAPGQTTIATVVLGEGRYRIFCSIPGHREAGMDGVVEAR